MNGFLMQEKKIQYQKHCLILDTFKDRYADTYQFLLYNVCLSIMLYFPFSNGYFSQQCAHAGEVSWDFPLPPQGFVEINKTAQDFCLSHTATKVQQQTQIYLNLPCG